MSFRLTSFNQLLILLIQQPVEWLAYFNLWQPYFRDHIIALRNIGEHEYSEETML